MRFYKSEIIRRFPNVAIIILKQNDYMKRTKISLSLLIVVILACVGAVNSFHIKHGKIYDDKWREVYFHGMNIAVKVPPYVPKTDAYDEKMSFVQEDIDKLKENGFNAIRLGIMWPGV